MEVRQREFNYLRERVLRRAGVALGDSKRLAIYAQLEPIIEELDLEGPEQLVALLQASGPESPLDLRVVEALLDTDTLFFRDYPTFEYLRHVALPDLVARNRNQKTLRLWSAACSSGQEAYSIAVLLMETMPEVAQWDVSILGTDISTTLIDKAKSGIYTATEFKRGLPESIGRRHFKKVGNKWIVNRDLRDQVDFHRMNLIHEWPADFPTFDIILLRNVLMYLNQDKRAELLVKLLGHMHEDGFIMVGGGEAIADYPNHFKKVNFAAANCYHLASRKRPLTEYNPKAIKGVESSQVPGTAATDINSGTKAEGEFDRVLRFRDGSKLSMTDPEFRRLSKLANSLYIFRGMSMEEIEETCRQISLFQYQDGQVVLQQGTRGSSFYIIFSGQARVVVTRGLLRKETQVAELGEGEIFGEMSLILDAPTNASIVAKGSLRVFVGTYELFHQLLTTNKSFATTVTEIAGKRGASSQSLKTLRQKGTPKTNNEDAGAAGLQVLYGDQVFRPKGQKRLEMDADDHTKLSRLLRRSYLFADLHVADIDKICGGIELFEFAPSKPVIKQHYRGDACYIIYSGQVRVVVDDEGVLNRGKEVARLGPGAVVGEISLIMQEPCTASVVPMVWTQAFVLSRELFDYLIENNERFASTVNAIAIKRTADLQEKRKR